MIKVTFQHPAVIAGQYYNANTELQLANQEQVEAGYKAAQKHQLRQKIKREIADPESLLGTTSDATAYTLDDTAMDILAVENSANSSYKEQRMSLYEQLHGEGAWDRAVIATQSWFDARVAKQIKLTIDVKGLDNVMSDVATRSTQMTNLLETAAATQ